MQKGDGGMHKFDYSFLDYGTLPAQLLNIATDIYSFIGGQDPFYRIRVFY